MLTLTTTAQKKLLETLHEHTHDPHMAIRIILNSASQPKNLDMILDRKQKGDCIVTTKGGTNLLLIQPSLASQLEGFILDYEEMMDDFTLEEITRH